MDTSSGSTAGDNFSANVTPTIPWWDLRIVRGLSDFNVGRNLVVSILYEVPTPTAFRGPIGFVTKGWQIGTILEASDGVPLWPLDGLEGDPMGQLTLSRWLSPTASRVPDATLLLILEIRTSTSRLNASLMHRRRARPFTPPIAIRVFLFRPVSIYWETWDVMRLSDPDWLMLISLQSRTRRSLGFPRLLMYNSARSSLMF